MSTEQTVVQRGPGTSGPVLGSRRIMAVAVALALTLTSLIGLAAPAQADFEPAVGGPVVLDGNDPMDHKSAIREYMWNVYDNLDANLVAEYEDNGRIAVVGTCADDLWDDIFGVTPDGWSGEFMPQDAFDGLDEFNTPSAIADLFRDIEVENYRHLHICSNYDSTLAIELEDELDRWGSAIADHVNRGGGLFATGHWFNWLEALFPGLEVDGGWNGSGTTYVTEEGEAFFRTLEKNDEVGAIHHYNFDKVETTSLQPLLTEGQDGTEPAVAIGGVWIRFPQISIDGATHGSEGEWTELLLRAADADGEALEGVEFTYHLEVIDGSGEAGLRIDGQEHETTDGDLVGTSTIGSDGTAKLEVFREEGLGGETRLTVSLDYEQDGQTLSAGSMLTTEWDEFPLPDAPTIASAVRSGDSVSLDWSPAAAPEGAEPTAYRVEYREQGTTQWTQHGTEPTDSSLTIEGLDTDKEYEFRVRSENVRGLGPWSSAVAESTPSPAPAPEPDPEPQRTSDGELARPIPGGSEVSIDGEDAGSDTTVSSGRDRSTVIGDGFEIEVWNADGDEQLTETGVGEVLRVPQGGNAGVRVDGFAPGSEVRVWLFSEPRLIGTFTTDADGALEQGLAEVVADLTPCAHTLQAEGELADGRQVAAALGIWVTADPFVFADVDTHGSHAPGIGCLEALDIVNGYSADTYDELDGISRAQAASVIARTLDLDAQAPPEFVDLDGGVHDDAIAALTEHGIIQGVGDGRFDPSGTLTRGQTASILAAAAGLEADDVASFPDVDGNAHAAAIAALTEHGVISGFDDGTFRPNAEVTRGQFASFTARLLPTLAEQRDTADEDDA